MGVEVQDYFTAARNLGQHKLAVFLEGATVDLPFPDRVKIGGHVQVPKLFNSFRTRHQNDDVAPGPRVSILIAVDEFITGPALVMRGARDFHFLDLHTEFWWWDGEAQVLIPSFRVAYESVRGAFHPFPVLCVV